MFDEQFSSRVWSTESGVQSLESRQSVSLENDILKTDTTFH